MKMYLHKKQVVLHMTEKQLSAIFAALDSVALASHETESDVYSDAIKTHRSMKSAHHQAIGRNVLLKARSKR